MFRDSPRKIVLAVILVVLWGVFLHKRVNPYDDPPRPAAPAAAPAPAEAPPLVVGAVATVLATVNWADPADPRAVPLRGQKYLFDTKDGVQVWDSTHLILTPLPALAAGVRLLDQAWVPFQSGPALGTLVAVRDAQLASVVLVREDGAAVERRLMLPIGFIPDAMVRLADDAALVCSSAAGHSLVVGGRGGELTQRSHTDAHPYAPDMLVRAGVVGAVEGFPDQKEIKVEADGRIGQPLLFDTRTCRWRARGLPEPMASALELTMSVRTDVRLNYAGKAIVAASWRDPLTREMKTLQTPLVWNEEHAQWWQRKTADLPGVPPQAVAGLLEGDWSYAAGDGRFAFHSSHDNQWREATQRLPAHDGFKLLYSRNEGVFVLLTSATLPGRIVHLDPASRYTQFRTSIAADNVVPFGRGALMVLDGASSKAAIISPDAPKPAPVASLPQAQRRSSGVELADGSVLVFGGLAAQCDPDQQAVCPQRYNASFRWVPVEQRWQAVPTLTVPYAKGESLAGGSTDLDARLGRSDFLLRGNALFYLSGNAIKWAGYQKDEASRLYRWQLEGKNEPLAQTRLNRTNATLIQLDDGRLAVVGGAAADEGQAPACAPCLEQRKEAVRRMATSLSRTPDDDHDAQSNAEAAVPQCASCTETIVSEGFATARSCEVYDVAGNRWLPGPWANHAGGRAVKLANGRVFKFGLLGASTRDAVYGAETADPALARWTAAPPFPFAQPATVTAMHAIGNQVVLVMDAPADRLVLWDDDSRSWQVRALPKHSAWSLHTQPRFITRGVDKQLLLIHEDGFEYLDWP